MKTEQITALSTDDIISLIFHVKDRRAYRLACIMPLQPDDESAYDMAQEELYKRGVRL